MGKAELAKSFFQRPFELQIGQLAHFPERMRQFRRRAYDGPILDDVRDLAFLGNHQDVPQEEYDYLVEFSSTPGGTCAFDRWLYCVPVVATINHSTRSREYLESHDFLGKADNRVLLTLTEAPWEAAPTLPVAAL